MALTGSYLDACCKEMQEAAREDLVDYISKDMVYLITTYQVDDGDGRLDTMTDKSVEISYCPFCGRPLKEKNERRDSRSHQVA